MSSGGGFACKCLAVDANNSGLVTACKNGVVWVEFGVFSDRIDFIGLTGGRRGEKGMDSMSLSGANGFGELSDGRCDLRGLNDGEGAQETYGVAAPGSSVESSEGKCSVVDKETVLPLVLLVLLLVLLLGLLFTPFRVTGVGLSIKVDDTGFVVTVALAVAKLRAALAANPTVLSVLPPTGAIRGVEAALSRSAAPEIAPATAADFCVFFTFFFLGFGTFGVCTGESDGSVVPASFLFLFRDFIVSVFSEIGRDRP